MTLGGEEYGGLGRPYAAKKVVLEVEGYIATLLDHFEDLDRFCCNLYCC